MADNKKKIAAALAAVSAYMQQEEAEVAQQMPDFQMPSVSSGAGLSQWSLSGRQEMMAMRRLIQLRVFDRLR